MFRNILLSAIASLKRKKTASLFTILTISLGMTMIVLMSSLYHSYTGNLGPYINRDRCLYLSDLKFEKNGQAAERIGNDSKNSTTDFIRKTLYDLDSTAIVGMYGRVHEEDFGPRYNPFKIKYIETDVNFWRIHHFDFLDGKAFSAEDVDNKEKVAIISRKMAVQLLGDVQVAGKLFDYGDQGKFRIAGIIEDVNPHFEVSADLYLPYTITSWDENNSTSFDGIDYYYNRGAYKGILMAQNKSNFKSIRNKFGITIGKLNKTGQVEEFDRVNAKLRTPSNQIPSMIGLKNDETGAIIFISMGVIFLLLPIIILSNINLYSLRDRLEEIGIRKSFGARRQHIIRQFFVENVMVTAVGCILALFLGYFLNRILAFILYRTTEIPGFEFNISLFSYLFLGTIVFGILTVVIPVIRISKVQPVLAINHNIFSGETRMKFKTRNKGLKVTTSILLSLVLFMCSLIMMIFSDYISGLGYETKNIIKIIVEDNDQKVYDDNYNTTRFDGFREGLLRIEGVEKVSNVLENPPFWIIPQYQDFIVNSEEKQIRTLETDSVFFDLLEIKPVKGVLYRSGIIEGNYLPAIATLAGEKEFFDGDAVGKTFKRKSDGQNIKIVGVIEKYKHHSSASPLTGIMVCRNRPSRSVLIKFNPNTNLNNLRNKISDLTKNWKGGNMLLSENDNIDTEKQQALKLNYSAYYGALLAISFLFLNAFMGYFTLTYYNVLTRKKEMGIRRASGANRQQIIWKILAENLSVMLIGSLVAVAIIWQIFHLINFNKWDIFWSGYKLSLAIGLVITLGSALVPAIKGSIVQPVEALAEE
ncbi:MAG TPA: FtsX-like permease family protein [Bacteroidales bacterium]|nr:FtsX-like permease family protein [Bacteroidales bacterium]